jgi:hypothetical protein
MNACTHEVSDKPVNLTPRLLSPVTEFSYKNPKTLNVYPAKADVENFFLLSEQFAESLHNTASQIVFEIRGNCKEILISFYGEESDIRIVDAAVKTFFSHVHTEIVEPEKNEGSLVVYDFVPDISAPFYKNMSSYRGFIVSPLNLLAQMFLQIPEDKKGIYQVLIMGLSGAVHAIVSECVDTEWKAIHGIDRVTSPSEQAGSVNKKLEYKSPEFRSYYSCSFRLLLPDITCEASINAFIANYVYDDKAFLIRKDFTPEAILQMANDRVSFHSGFLVNSHELAGILHMPVGIMGDKEFDDIFLRVPAGDYPKKTAEKSDVLLGTWACGQGVGVFSPVQRFNPHIHIMGAPRAGKSVLLADLAIKKVENGESVMVVDFQGDLNSGIMSRIPVHLISKVVFIDFGIKGLTPLLTIRENLNASLVGAGKFSDDMSASMETITSTKNSQAWFGPKMAFGFSCVFYIYASVPEINFADLRLLLSKSAKGKVIREKIKSKITHPIVINFLDEIQYSNYDSMAPVLSRLSHLLLDEGSLRFFTLEDDKNKISLKDIMENGKLCLVNLSCGSIGKQRASLLAGLFDSFVNNLIIQRANIPFHERKPFTLIKDEFYMGPGDLDIQVSALSKYQLSVIFAHQYLSQVEGKTRDVLAIAGTQIYFKLRREDAEEISKSTRIPPEEFTKLKPFTAFVCRDNEVVKINTPRPGSDREDLSEQIKAMCFEKYYMKHGVEKKAEKVQPQKKIFDQI